MDTTQLNNASVNIEIADNEKQFEAIFRFRCECENREEDKIIDEEKLLASQDEYDKEALQIFAEFEKKIVASFRVNVLKDSEVKESFNNSFGVELFREFCSDQKSFTSMLNVDPGWKGTTILGRILNAAYHLMRQKNIQFDFTDSAPSLVQFHEHLGYRRYKENFTDPQRGYRVPLVLVVEDIEHLKKVRSPFHKYASTLENSTKAAEWFKQRFPASIGTVSERLMPIQEYWRFLANRLHEDTVPLLKDLNDDEVKRFLTSGVVLKVKADDLIVRKGDIGNEMFVLLSGAVDVKGKIRDKDVSLAVLGQGEIFGEMALLSSTKRSADVVALDDCEVLVLTQSFLKKAMKMMPETASKILFNLSIILCERLRSKNENFLLLANEEE